VRLQPKRVKYRKSQRGSLKGKASQGRKLNFGEYGLVAQEAGWITARQIESSRVAIIRAIGREARLWIRIFPDKAVTKKPLETRMGKGKGEPDFWVAPVKPGRILFELGGVEGGRVEKAFRLASHKLPLKTRVISSDEDIL